MSIPRAIRECRSSAGSSSLVRSVSFEGQVLHDPSGLNRELQLAENLVGGPDCAGLKLHHQPHFVLPTLQVLGWAQAHDRGITGSQARLDRFATDEDRLFLRVEGLGCGIGTDVPVCDGQEVDRRQYEHRNQQFFCPALGVSGGKAEQAFCQSSALRAGKPTALKFGIAGVTGSQCQRSFP